MKKADIQPNTVYRVHQPADCRTAYIRTATTIEWVPQYGDLERAIRDKEEYGEGFTLAYLSVDSFVTVTPDCHKREFVEHDVAVAEMAASWEAADEKAALYSYAISEDEDDIEHLPKLPGYVAGVDYTADEFKEAMKVHYEAMEVRYSDMPHRSYPRCQNQVYGRPHTRHFDHSVDVEAYWNKAAADAAKAAQGRVDAAAAEVRHGHWQKWANAEYEANVVPVVQEALRAIPQGFVEATKYDDYRKEWPLQKAIAETVDGDDASYKVSRNWNVRLDVDNDGNPFVDYYEGWYSLKLELSFAAMTAMAAAWEKAYGDRPVDEVLAEFGPTFNLTRPPDEALDADQRNDEFSVSHRVNNPSTDEVTV